MRREAPVKVVDFEKQPLALDLQGAKVALAVGIVVGIEAVESGNGVEDSKLLRTTQRDHAQSSVRDHRSQGGLLVLQLSLVASDSSYLWDDCVEVSHVGRLGKRPCLA